MNDATPTPDSGTPVPAAPAPAAKDEAIARLKTAIRELETGEGLTDLTGGHGIQSRTFEFSWTTPTLDISLSMPYARVLSGDDTLREDDASIGAACRLAILLIEADAAKTLLAEGEVSMTVAYDKLGGPSYQSAALDGTLVDSDSDWSPLVARLERALQSSTSPDALSIIWP
jgi:hypothetical protein